MAEFYETGCLVLEGAGYQHYEISNWAKPGFASRHNLKYWRREAYLGFGAGAHSFSGTERWANGHDAAGGGGGVFGGGGAGGGNEGAYAGGGGGGGKCFWVAGSGGGVVVGGWRGGQGEKG